MLPSSALPQFPIDARSGVGVRVRRQGTSFLFDLDDIPIPTSGSGATFSIRTPNGPVALRDGQIFTIKADRAFEGNAFLAVDDNVPHPLLAANGLPLPRVLTGRNYRVSYDSAEAAFRADALAIVGNDELAPVPGLTLKGNAAASSGRPLDLGTDVVRALLRIDHVTNTSDAEKAAAGPIADAIKTVLDLLNGHAGSTSNPHGTTAAQVGAYTKAETDTAVTAARAGAIADVRGGASPSTDTLKKVADLIAVAAQGVFPAATLAQLNANTFALQGTVDSDGANNGSYARTVRDDPSTPWVRVSTATLNGLDARATALGALISALQTLIADLGLTLVNDPDYGFAIAHQDTKSIAVAIGKDLSLTLPGTRKLKQFTDEWAEAKAFEDTGAVAYGIRQSDGRFYAPGLSDLTAAFPQVSQIAFVGQSQLAGAEDDEILTATDPGFGNRRPARGVRTYDYFENGATPELRADGGFTDGFDLVPLIETYFPGSGETSASALANALKSSICGGPYAAADLSNAFPWITPTYGNIGGRALIELSKADYQTDPSNTVPGVGGTYKTTVDDVRRVRKSARRLGLTHGVIGILFRQGENNGGGIIWPDRPPIPYDNFQPRYSTDLLQLWTDYNTDIRAITGQRRAIPMFIDQPIDDWAGNAQRLLARNHPHIFMVQPIYQVPSALNSWLGTERGHYIHMVADGQRLLGNKDAQAMHQVLVLGKDWRPTDIMAAWRWDNTRVVLEYYVPFGDLQLNVTDVAKLVNFGFRLFNGTRANPGAEIQITNVYVIAGEGKIVLEGPSIPNGPMFVDYGLQSLIKAATTSVVTNVGAGAPYTRLGVQIPSTELTFEGDIRSDFADPLKEGCFSLGQVTDTVGFFYARDVRLENGRTIVRGETRSVEGTFKAGTACTIRRDRPGGNVSDSDTHLSHHAWVQAYGTRQGAQYSMVNWALVANQQVSL